MKNAEKIMIAMEKAFTSHKIEISYNFNAKIYCVFVDDDYDEIELTIKAPLASVRDFVNRANGYEIMRCSVERGLQKWENESHPNN